MVRLRQLAADLRELPYQGSWPRGFRDERWDAASGYSGPEPDAARLESQRLAELSESRQFQAGAAAVVRIKSGQAWEAEAASAEWMCRALARSEARAKQAKDVMAERESVKPEQELDGPAAWMLQKRAAVLEHLAREGATACARAVDAKDECAAKAECSGRPLRRFPFAPLLVSLLLFDRLLCALLPFELRSARTVPVSPPAEAGARDPRKPPLAPRLRPAARTRILRGKARGRRHSRQPDGGGLRAPHRHRASSSVSSCLRRPIPAAAQGSRSASPPAREPAHLCGFCSYSTDPAHISRETGSIRQTTP